MSDAAFGFLTHLLIGVIAAIPPTIAALATLRKAKETHHVVNSRMDELLETVRREARAAGVKEGESNR